MEIPTTFYVLQDPIYLRWSFSPYWSPDSTCSQPKSHFLSRNWQAASKVHVETHWISRVLFPVAKAVQEITHKIQWHKNNPLLCSQILWISTWDMYSTAAHLCCLLLRLWLEDLQARPGIIYWGHTYRLPLTHTKCPWDTLGFFKAWWLSSKMPIPQKVRERGCSRVLSFKSWPQKSCSVTSTAFCWSSHKLLLRFKSPSLSENMPKSHQEKHLWWKILVQ